MDDEGAGSGPRRRRRRRGPDEPIPGPEVAPPPPPPPPSPARPRRTRPAADAGERGLRDIVGAGPSQLGVNGALRGRDVNRPTDDDLAEAEANLVIVRRNWQPLDVRK